MGKKNKQRCFVEKKSHASYKLAANQIHADHVICIVQTKSEFPCIALRLRSMKMSRAIVMSPPKQQSLKQYNNNFDPTAAGARSALGWDGAGGFDD